MYQHPKKPWKTWRGRRNPPDPTVTAVWRKVRRMAKILEEKQLVNNRMEASVKIAYELGFESYVDFYHAANDPVEAAIILERIRAIEREAENIKLSIPRVQDVLRDNHV